MPARDLPARLNLDQYKKQAKDLLKRWKSDDPKTTRKLADAQFAIAREHGFETWKVFTDRIAALTGREPKAALFKAAADALIAGDASGLERLLRNHEQMFRNERPPATWSVGLAPNESPGDARTIVARGHFFETWNEFAAFKQQLSDPSSLVTQFERAVDAVVAGDADPLTHLLKQKPDLVHARSTRTHHSMLLHYVGANGVEGWRQRTPRTLFGLRRSCSMPARRSTRSPTCITAAGRPGARRDQHSSEGRRSAAAADRRPARTRSAHRRARRRQLADRQQLPG